MGGISRLAAGVLALAAVATAVALGVAFLRGGPHTAPSVVVQVPAVPSSTGVGFPVPPAGAVVYSREDGPDALALAVAHSFVQVSVVGQQGTGVSGLAVTVNGMTAAACGPGCYRAAVRGARTIDARVGAARWRVAVPADPQDASALVARAARVWRSLRTLAFFDRLGSDATHVVASTWRAVAPDRLSYRVVGGSEAVIVGDRRWDRSPGGRWVESAQTIPVRQPVPLWQSETDAHVVGATGSTWRITFFDPRTPAWFDITVDKRTFHTLDAHMNTSAHFMFERYGPFDGPLVVAPPTSR
jgi:hypothetical protein